MKDDRPFAKPLKTESERLTVLINEFLEVQIEKEDLLSNPSMIAHYRKFLEENLPPADEYNWISELDSIEREESKSKYIDGAAYMISSIHHLLKSIWNDYKEKVPTLYNIPKSLAVERHLRGLYLLDELGKKWEDKLTEYIITGGELLKELKQREKEKTIHEVIVGDADGYCYHPKGVFTDFITLLKCVGPENLKKCDTKGCNKWFVWSSELEKEKKYCSHICGAKNTSKEKREKDRKGYNEYMRDYRTKQKEKSEKKKKGKKKRGS